MNLAWLIFIAKMEGRAVIIMSTARPPHSNCIRSRMRVPIFSGNGVLLGHLSQDDIPWENLEKVFFLFKKKNSQFPIYSKPEIQGLWWGNEHTYPQISGRGRGQQMLQTTIFLIPLVPLDSRKYTYLDIQRI